MFRGLSEGDGKRIKKVVPATGETTVFVYDAGGQLIAEYSTIVEPVSTAQVSYLTSDHLGSPRITTDKDWDVYSRRDFLPFGEELTAFHTAQRSVYGGDTVRQKFTGYERDDETALDFAQARMHNDVHGRFTSVDPSRKSISTENPQSWHRYIYVLNNPYKFVDENGKWPTENHNWIIQQAFGGLTKSEIKRIQDGSKYTDFKKDEDWGWGTFNPKNANEHSMAVFGQDIDEAKKGIANFIAGKVRKAVSTQLDSVESEYGDLSFDALFTFGEGSHAIEDRSSPAHGADKVYTLAGKAPDKPSDLSKREQVIAGYELIRHKLAESHTPTLNEVKPSIIRMRAAFLITFGKKHFRRAVKSKQGRKETVEYLNKLGINEFRD